MQNVAVAATVAVKIVGHQMRAQMWESARSTREQCLGIKMDTTGKIMLQKKQYRKHKIEELGHTHTIKKVNGEIPQIEIIKWKTQYKNNVECPMEFNFNLMRNK